MRRSHRNFKHKAADRFGLALSFYFDCAIWEVVHKARDAMLIRRSLGEPPKSNTLHSPGNDHMDPYSVLGNRA